MQTLNLKNPKTPVDSKFQCSIIEDVTFKNHFTNKYGAFYTYYIKSGAEVFEYVSKSDNQTHFIVGDYAWFEITNKKNPYNKLVKIKKSHEAAWHTKNGHFSNTPAPATKEVAPVQPQVKAEVSAPVQPQVQTVLCNDKKQALITFAVAQKLATEFVLEQIKTGYLEGSNIKPSSLINTYALRFYRDAQNATGVKFK